MSRTHQIGADVLAGLTVALVGLPQCLAYAMMSGLPPAYGLSTAAVAGFVAALLGRSAQVVTGPTNTTSLLILGALSPFLAGGGGLGPDGLPVLATLTLLAGVIRLAAALAGGAALVRFIPESVLTGFTAGAGILIGVMQLDEALGFPPVRDAGLRGEAAGLLELIRTRRVPALPAVATAASIVLLLVLGRRRFPRAPVALAAIAASAVIAWATGLDERSGLPLVTDRSSVPSGWPSVALPVLNPALVETLFVPATAIVLLGTLELLVTARAHGARPDLRREVLAQGWANVAGAFAGAFPASASLGRSALLRLGGARTRLAAATAAAAMVPLLLAGGPLVGRIPQAALAGVLLVVAARMVDRTAIRRLWRAAPETRLLLVVTLVATLALPLEWAILFGAGLGLLIHLARTSAPRLRLLRPSGSRLLPLNDGDTSETVVVEVSGDLHYAAAAPFLTEVERLLPPSARDVVLDLSHAHQIRYSALVAMEQLADELDRTGARLHLAGVAPEVQALLARAESRLEVTPARDEPGASVRECLSALDAGRGVTS
jgi:SulP family sulfate permease